MDRQVVSAKSFENADDHVTSVKNKTPLDRLNNACYIINQIFQNPNTAIDKTLTQSRKHAKSI